MAEKKMKPRDLRGKVDEREQVGEPDPLICVICEEIIPAGADVHFCPELDDWI